MPNFMFIGIRRLDGESLHPQVVAKANAFDVEWKVAVDERGIVLKPPHKLHYVTAIDEMASFDNGMVMDVQCEIDDWKTKKHYVSLGGKWLMVCEQQNWIWIDGKRVDVD